MKFEMIKIYDLDVWDEQYKTLKDEFKVYFIDLDMDCIVCVPSKPVINPTLPVYVYTDFDPWFNPIYLDKDNMLMMIGSCPKSNTLLHDIRHALYSVLSKYVDCMEFGYRIIEPRAQHLNEETGVITFDLPRVFCDIGIANLEDRDMFVSYINVKDVPIMPRCINPNGDRSIRSALHLEDSQIERFGQEVLEALKTVFE